MSEESKKKNYQKHLEWLRNNKETVSAHQKKSRAKHLEARKQNQKEYYQANRERLIEKQRQYYKKNSETIKEYQRNRRVAHPEFALLRHAKERAKKWGISFNITKKDITIPEECPFLGIPIFVGSNALCDNSPTIDRINNGKGYTKKNIIVISYKANRIKNNATFEEFETIYLNWKTKKEGK